MLNKETQKKLKALGFDVKALNDAVANTEEVDFDVPEIKTYTDEDLASRDDNSKKAGIKEGKDVGKGIALKEIAKKLGIEGDFKEPDVLSDAISKSGKGDTNEQVKLLQAKIAQAESERDTAMSETKTAKRDAELLSNLPANRKGDLTDSEYINLFKMSHEITEDGIKKGGNILREEKSQNALSLKDAISSMFTERKFIAEGQQQQQGRGAGDQHGNNNTGIKSFSAAEKQWEKENPDKSMMTGEFQAYVATLAKEPGFNINA